MSFNIDNYISNLAYINKDFNSTWEEILETIPKLTNKWVPSEANESDPLVVLLKELGIVTDKLNYNIDKNILETFPDLLTQLRAAYSVFSSMGYVPQWYRSALLNITLIYNGGAGDVGSNDKDLSPTEFTLPRFTEVCDSNTNIIYTLLKTADTIFTTKTASQASILAMEGTINDLTVNGNTLIDVSYLDSQNRLYFLQSNVAQNGIFISEDPTFEKINIEDSNYDSEDTTYDGFTESDTWQRVTNIYQHLPGSKVFQFGIDPSTGSAYIQFPEDIGNLIQGGIYIKYILSSGESGNIKARTISKFVNDPSVEIEGEDGDTTYTITSANFTVTNTLATQNGKNPETIEEMQANYSKIVGTFNTLVTLKDYENYIYSEEDEVGRPIVSNIKVSDRTCDLYSTYKVKTLTTSSEIKTLTSQLLDGDKEQLTAYNLRLYPLRPVNSVVDYSSFKSTFDYVIDEEGNNSDRRFIQGLEDVVYQAKTILHDFKTPSGVPIFLDYELQGEIYLHKSLSKAEAAEVRNNVVQAIYQNFNARELTFGKEIDYSQMVDTIKASDPRIQYVALRPIEYNVDATTLEIFNERNGGLDIRSRSILKGCTPWTTYEDALIYWGSKLDTTVGSSSEMVGTYGDPNGIYTSKVSDKLFIKSIQPEVSISFSGSDKLSSYEVGKNETLSIIIPGYRTATTYANYCYMVWEGREDDVKADTPYTLGAKEEIRIYERRPEKLNQSTNLLATLKQGTVVSCNTEYTVDKLKDKAVNMSTTVSLSVIEKDIENINSVLTDDIAYARGIKIATNSQGLCTLLRSSSNGSYTLNIGEYLLWTNNTDVVLEVGTIGEGNTIIKNGNINNSELLQPLSGDLDLAKTSFVTCDNDVLQYRANTISSFGEGYILQGVMEKAGQSEPGFILASQYKTDQVFTLADVKEIKYKKTIDSDDSWQTLPGKAENESYQASLCLALIVGSNTTQELGTRQLEGSTLTQRIKVERTRLKVNENDLVTPYQFAEVKDGSDKEQSLEVSLDGKLPAQDCNFVVQSTSSILHPGGPALQLIPLESVGSILQTLEVPKKYLTAQGRFVRVSAETKIPSGGGYYVFSATKSKDVDRTIKYFVAKSDENTTRELPSDLDQVGQIKKVAANAEVWIKDSKGFKSQLIQDLFDETNPYYVELTESQIYNSEYYPLYEPEDSELINNPMDPMSFFKDAHICNKYVLPRLYAGEKDPLRNLVISTLSIRE